MHATDCRVRHALDCCFVLFGPKVPLECSMNLKLQILRGPPEASATRRQGSLIRNKLHWVLSQVGPLPEHVSRERKDLGDRAAKEYAKTCKLITTELRNKLTWANRDQTWHVCSPAPMICNRGTLVGRCLLGSHCVTSFLLMSEI